MYLHMKHASLCHVNLLSGEGTGNDISDKAGLLKTGWVPHGSPESLNHSYKSQRSICAHSNSFNRMPDMIFRPTLALVRKNLLLKRHGMAQSICLAIGIPLAIVAFVLYLFRQSTAQAVDIDTSLALELDVWLKKYPVSKYGPLAWAPAGSSNASAFIAHTGLPDANIRSFSSRNDLSRFCRDNDCLAGVVFGSDSPSYELLVDDSNHLFAKTYSSQDPTISTAEYVADMQGLVEHAMINSALGKSTSTPPPKVLFKQLESANIRGIIFEFTEKFIGGMLATMFIPLVYSLVSDMVAEKEARIREGMLMMGLSPIAYNLSWLFTYAVIYLPVYALCAVILKLVVYETTSLPIILLWILATAVSCIGLCFVLESFLSSARSAGLASVAILTVAAIVETIINAKYFADMTGLVKALLCFLSPFGFIFSHRIIARKEGQFDGLTLSTWTENVEGISFLTTFIATLATIPLYFFIGWYLSNVIPGEYGVAKPFYFLFTLDYWVGQSSHDDSNYWNGRPVYQDSDAVVEEAGPNLPVGISINGLTRIFRQAGANSQHVAVDGLHLQAYEGQVLSLLGKNGAGKSTLISMITQLLPPSTGSFTIRGRSSLAGRQRASTSEDTLGVCPQHDVLWDGLTCRQTLELFAHLKGVPVGQVNRAVQEAIVSCDLIEKVNSLTSTLSGGQKRKLSVGIAYIGGSRTIILDEPSSGMDPLSRRAIWDIVNREKQGRTVIFTTHFMDEADYLGDRIAILASGKLKAVGTPSFLKRSFGVGYTLTVIRNDGYDSSLITNAILANVPGAVMGTETLREITFRLPSKQRHRYSDLLMDLETSSGSYGIRSWGLSVTSLEEVFIQIASKADEEILRETPPRHDSVQEGDMNVIEMSQLQKEKNIPSAGAATVPGGTVFLSQVPVLARKLLRLNIREPALPICRVLLPLLSICFSAYLMRNVKPPVCEPPLAAPSVPISWATIGGPKGPTLVVSPSDELIHAVDASIPTQPISSFPPFDNILKSSTDVSAALRLNNFAGNSSWDGSYLVAQGDLNGDATYAMAVINLASNMYLTVSGTPVRITGSFGRFDSRRAAQDMVGDITASVALFVVFSAVFSALSVVPIVRERVSKAKHQQRVSGATPFSYWSSFIVWDLLMSFIVAALITIIFAIAGTSVFKGQLVWVFLSFFWFFTSSTAFAYALSTRFETPAGAIGGILTLLSLIPVFFLQFFIEGIFLESSAQTIKWYALGFSIYNPASGLAYNIFGITNWGPIRCPGDQGAIGDTVASTIGFVLLIQAAQTVILFGLAIGTDAWRQLIHRPGRPEQAAPPTPSRTGNPDVDAEEERILKSQQTDLIAVTQLKKEFLCPNTGVTKHALKGLTLGVDKGECMVLLGPNGAGKTTTMTIIAGDQVPTSGSCVVNGYSLLENLPGVQRSIGVTPQFDALMKNLTVAEHFDHYARLKGVPSREVSSTVAALLEMLDLLPYANKRVQNLSGGNRRKVSVGIAVVGQPAAILIDEGSTGMDPISKRYMWKVISQLSQKHAVILTTHSMEEAESVASKVGIVTNGRLQCLGSVQHLRDRYGAGYQIEIRARDPSAMTGICAFMHHMYPSSICTEQYPDHGRFLLPKASISSLGSVFAQLEEFGDDLGVSDYAVSHTSLEEVFLSFARASEAAKLNAENYKPASVIRAFNDSAIMDPMEAMYANILFMTFGGGLFMGLAYFLMGLFVGLFGMICGSTLLFRRGLFVMAPYGRSPPLSTAHSHPRGCTSGVSTVVRWVAMVLTAPLLVLGHLLIGCALSITIIFHPMAKMHFKMCNLAFYAGSLPRIYDASSSENFADAGTRVSHSSLPVSAAGMGTVKMYMPETQPYPTHSLSTL
ncbi:hypothetical protein DFJ77DRAFT_478934 [Powellomyces hirtus]|nr:hypothetical protein DFJ77DRAFT_478934 [Powellomyces hirtus]